MCMGQEMGLVCLIVPFVSVTNCLPLFPSDFCLCEFVPVGALVISSIKTWSCLEGLLFGFFRSCDDHGFESIMSSILPLRVFHNQYSFIFILFNSCVAGSTTDFSAGGLSYPGIFVPSRDLQSFSAGATAHHERGPGSSSEVSSSSSPRPDHSEPSPLQFILQYIILFLFFMTTYVPE